MHAGAVKLLLTSCALVALACAGPPQELGPQPIYDGETAGDEFASVVMVNNSSSGTTDVCSGTVVAPNVVLTARHCVAVYRDGVFSCSADGELITSSQSDAGFIGADVDPASLSILSDPTHAATPLALGKAIFGPPTSNICHNDLAWIVLDRELDLPVMPMRVGMGTERNELLDAVGYGQGDTALATRRVRRDRRVRTVGRSAFHEATEATPPDTFVTEPGACRGDSGGPALSQSPRSVTGVFSLLVGTCGDPLSRTVYTQVASFEDDLWAAFDAAGAQPELVQPEPTSSSGSSGCTVAVPGGVRSAHLAPCLAVLALSVWRQRRRMVNAGGRPVREPGQRCHVRLRGRWMA